MLPQKGAYLLIRRKISCVHQACLCISEVRHENWLHALRHCVGNMPVPFVPAILGLRLLHLYA